jgi:hypothetical protein
VFEIRVLRRMLVGYMGEMSMDTKFWLESLNGKRLLVEPKHRWEYNIKMDSKEVGCENIDWIHLLQGREH